MPKHSLVIVDMIEAYLTPGQKLYCDAAPKIVPAINLLACATREKEGVVVFANTTLTSPDEPIARKWGMHAVAGTSGPNVWHEIERGPADFIVPKTSYNSFFRTSLDDLLRSQDVESVAIAGIHTHVCVLLTAAAASDYGYDVTAFEDAMTTSYRPNHETRLRFFSTHIGTLTTVPEYISAL
jgi:nicotinamidase/pyrazinamidase